ncbi:hypothetical protein NMY22_g13604 [Coprinellus aureogranulatus]|nr:hypothetical protein NMY22_g13604 [Coprinellus aureogranulatus]
MALQFLALILGHKMTHPLPLPSSASTSGYLILDGRSCSTSLRRHNTTNRNTSEPSPPFPPFFSKTSTYPFRSCRKTSSATITTSTPFAFPGPVLAAYLCTPTQVSVDEGSGTRGSSWSPSQKGGDVKDTGGSKEADLPPATSRLRSQLNLLLEFSSAIGSNLDLRRLGSAALRLSIRPMAAALTQIDQTFHHEYVYQPALVRSILGNLMLSILTRVALSGSKQRRNPTLESTARYKPRTSTLFFRRQARRRIAAAFWGSEGSGDLGEPVDLGNDGDISPVSSARDHGALFDELGTDDGEAELSKPNSSLSPLQCGVSALPTPTLDPTPHLGTIESLSVTNLAPSDWFVHAPTNNHAIHPTIFPPNVSGPLSALFCVSLGFGFRASPLGKDLIKPYPGFFVAHGVSSSSTPPTTECLLRRSPPPSTRHVSSLRNAVKTAHAVSARFFS